MKDLRAFIHQLSLENELVVVHEEVDPNLEIAEIHRRVVSKGGPALLFKNVKGSKFPVVTNLFGTEKRVEMAFPKRPEKLIDDLVTLFTQKFPPSLSTLWKHRFHIKTLFQARPKLKGSGKVLDIKMDPVNLEDLPILQCWPDDGGNFITLPLVYTEPVSHGAPNLGMYRIQRFDQTTTGLHFQIAKGGGFHFHEAEQIGKDLPVSIFLGGPPALMFGAIAPLPENVPELLFAALMLGDKLHMVKTDGHPHQIPADCEFAILGHARAMRGAFEGPFGDHFGYYGKAHDFPVLHVESIYHRKDAIYPATVVGKPIQEDLFIGNYLQKLFSPLIRLAMPGIKSLWTYAEAGFHPLVAAVVKERYEKEALTSAFRILGEGQLSLSNVFFSTDQNIDLQNVKTVIETVLSRMRPEQDMYILSHTSNDTLDY